MSASSRTSSNVRWCWAQVSTIGVEELPERLRQRPATPLPSSPERRLADVEREHILTTLEAASGNKAATARSLGVNRKTLYRKLRQHHIVGSA